jgi:cytochrome P450
MINSGASEVLQDDEENTLDYLSYLNSVGDKKKWSFVRQWMKDSPLPFFKQLREQSPVLVTSECTLLALYDDVIEALKQPKIFTVALYKPKMGDFLMTEDETPMHNDDRSIMMSLLKREDVPRIRKYVANKSKQILDDSDGEIDLIETFSRTVPVSLVQDVFGLDGVSQKTLLRWSHLNQYDAFNNQHFQNFTGREVIEKSRKKANVWVLLYALSMFVRKYWHILRGKPKSDTVTRMLREHSIFEKGFHIIRQGVNTAGLLIGTVETTSEAVSNALHQLFLHPDHLELAIKLAQGDDDEAFDRIVWEALRSQPIAPYLMRKLSQDYTIGKGTDHETTIPQGTTVLCLITSAMFDPSAFENPEKFNPTRPYGKSFQFGFGHHECIGKMIGMVMIPEMVRQVLLRPNLRQESQADFGGGPFPQHHSFSWGKK